MPKSPTPAQFWRLLLAGNGAVITHPRRADWMPLLRQGWVERVGQESPRGGLLPPLRITASGFEALAVGLAKHGWLEMER